MAAPHVALRGLARAVDLGVQFALLDVAWRLAPWLPDPLLTLPESALTWVDLGVGATSLVLYTAVAEWWGGATLGKVLTGLRVATADGQPISFRAALIRGAAFFVDGLFLGFVAYTAMARDPERRRLGDVWAGTRVVRKGEVPEGPVHAGWVLGAAVALAVVLASYVIAA